MSYFLKVSNVNKKGNYLQIYESRYIPNKGPRNFSFKAIGYECDLRSDKCPDPIRYYQKVVDSLNKEKKETHKVGDVSTSKNVGYFLIKVLLDSLDIDETIKLMSSNKSFHFELDDFLRTLIYAQIVDPRSKLKAYENVIPSLFGGTLYSYSQILDALNYIGGDYEKFIELFNFKMNKEYKVDTSKVFFDCTNYYFEIDLEDELRRKGPSKEERHSPIISQALLLDKNQIPIGMKMFPGNQSEKPKLREMIEETKNRFKINGRIVQVADKGLNCAKNVYFASIEGNDGYIFSKSIKGNYLPRMDKDWVRFDDEYNKWNEVYDEEGVLLYRYKEIIDTFSYSFLDENKKKITFEKREKRIATYNPYFAKKRRIEINKEVDKIKLIISTKEVHKAEYGDALKYVIFPKDNTPSLNLERIEEDLSMAGYNMLVTSEINMDAKEVYKVYHHLWRIEESFKIMKSYLEARPVFLQKKDSIYGHFLICYLALVSLRLLELKIFKDKIPLPKIIDYIRRFTVTETKEHSFVNNITKKEILDEVKYVTGLATLDNLYLTKKDLKNIFNSDLITLE